MGIFVAIDIGGTFTDLIAFNEQTGELVQTKSPTTPSSPVEGLMDCLRKSHIPIKNIGEVIHGSTVAINTVIERKGACTALVVTQGMRDVYRIGRGNRIEAYNLLFQRPRPLVSRRLTFEVTERMLASGEVLIPLHADEVPALCASLKEQNVQAVAVCFLHAYANPKHEQEVGEALRLHLPNTFVSLSHEIMREYREYERTSTTVVNAYIGPRVSQYVARLNSDLNELGFSGRLSIMQSNGGLMTPELAIKRPVSMMESGPVGGIIASAEVGQALGSANIIAFDMGGTTAKTSLIWEGKPAMAQGYYVGGYATGHPVMGPVVDVVEVGAGGGSIAWIDEVGALKVGPQSAGADPGPICYRRGGVEPTITDANVVLGRVSTKDFLGGEMPLDYEAAYEGIKQRIAEPLGLSVTEAANAIVEIAIAKMSLAVREVSVEKGYDPRDFALVASGGAGPLHAVAVARELSIPTVVIPRFPAHFSALGMLMADERYDFVRTYFHPMGEVELADVQRVVDETVADAKKLMQQAQASSAPSKYQAFLDLRYVGQEFTLSVPVTRDQLLEGAATQVRREFDRMYDERYAHHAADEPVEVVNIRVVVQRRRPKVQLPTVSAPATDHSPQVRPVFFQDSRQPLQCPVYQRELLRPSVKIQGPAIVQEYASTTVLFNGDTCVVADTGELIVSLEVR